jgi:hypothetical protein
MRCWYQFGQYVPVLPGAHIVERGYKSVSRIPICCSQEWGRGKVSYWLIVKVECHPLDRDWSEAQTTRNSSLSRCDWRVPLVPQTVIRPLQESSSPRKSLRDFPKISKWGAFFTISKSYFQDKECTEIPARHRLLTLWSPDLFLSLNDSSIECSHETIFHFIPKFTPG